MMDTRPSGRLYLRTFLAVSGTLLLTVVLINLVMDPYDVSQLVRIDRLNSSRPKEWDNARLKKPFDIWRGRYEGIVLGTSLVERGIDPAYGARQRPPLAFYNSGLSGLRMHEARSLLRNAVEMGGVRFAVISLDFPWSVHPTHPGDLPRKWSVYWQVTEYLQTLVSGTTLLDSLSTIRASWRRSVSLQHFPGGLLNGEDHARAHGMAGYSATFDQTDAVYLNHVYRYMLPQQERLKRTGFDLEDLAGMLRLARRRRVDLIFFVPPAHAREMEVLEYLGLMPLYMQWLSEIVCVLETDPGAGPGAASFPLWDFSGYNSVTTESVPPKEDGAARMLWFYDPVHYTRRGGRAILNRVLDLGDPEFSSLTDFGEQLHSTTLTHHLASMIRSRERYIERFPEVPKAIAALHRGPPPAPVSKEAFEPPRGCLPEASITGSIPPHPGEK